MKIKRFIKRVRAFWAELDYAQRRMFEIRTGTYIDEIERRRRDRATIAQLERTYAADDLAAEPAVWVQRDDLAA